MFLGNPQHPHNLIIFHLKTDVHKISGHEDVLVLLLNHCCDAFEERRFLFASEKHMLLRAMPYLLYLMDSDEKDGNNVFRSKKFRLDRVQRIFKTTPIVPLYGDMKISIEFVLKQCAHWNEEEMAPAWVTRKEGKLDSK